MTDDPTAELLAKTMRLAARAAADEELAEPVAVQPVQAAPRQAGGTPPGFVDLVFDRDRLVAIRDERGGETEIGHWLEEGANRILRLARPRLSPVNGNAPGAHHAADPSTAKEAAYSQLPKSGEDRSAVLGVFIRDWKAGGHGMIDEDLAARARSPKTGELMGLYTAAPRRTELVKGGWLQDSKRRGRTQKHRPSVVWELTPEAIARLGLTREGHR